MSQAVVWSIVRQNHAYLVKSRKSGGVQFSKHPGIANDKAIAIQADGKGVSLKCGNTKASWGAHKGQRITVVKAGNLVGKMNPALKGAARKRVSALIRASKA